MSPDTYSQAEIVRLLRSLDTRMGKMEERLDERYVPRETWDTAWGGLRDWRTEVGVRITDLEADQARARKEHREDMEKVRQERVAGNRWAVTTAIAGAGLLATIVSLAVTTAMKLAG